MKKKTIPCISIILIVIALIIGIYITKKQNNNVTEELTKINLNEVTRSVFYAPQYVAIANGFFEEDD